MYPHIIHLREPWRRTSAEGTTTLLRTFNAPTGLDDRESLWLVVEAPSREAKVSLNDHPQGTVAVGATGEFDITSNLKSRNEVRLNFSLADKPPEFSSVRLEIRLKS